MAAQGYDEDHAERMQRQHHRLYSNRRVHRVLADMLSAEVRTGLELASSAELARILPDVPYMEVRTIA